MKCIIVLLLCHLSFVLAGQPLSVYGLSCEQKASPVGIGTESPRLGWKIISGKRGSEQTSYQIRLSADSAFANVNIIWNSGKVTSAQSHLVAYKGVPLQSSTIYYWQVKVWDNHHQVCSWSKKAFFVTGVLQKEEWKARWIEPVQDTARHKPAVMVRKDFALLKKIATAKLHLTSHGIYYVYINGKKAGDQVFAPGWTSYDKRLQYQTYDVTPYLKTGNNTIGVVIGDGWYRGTLGWIDQWGLWGKQLGLFGQLNVSYTDGSTDVVATDGSWKGLQDSPVTLNGVYEGEHYDARKEQPGWNEAGYNDKMWKPVAIASYDLSNLVATETLPVRKISERKPVAILRTPSGRWVADMGQNMVGWIRFRLKGTPGKTITIKHAEVLDKHGEFYTANLRAAPAQLKYTFRTNGVEEYEPRFTFMGFRYVTIENIDKVSADDITGVVIHSDLEHTGTFECSDTLINQLQQNILWSQKGNFLDVPTDCPQRDERLGWTGDAQVFARTASFNMNTATFFSKWLKDLAADQYSDGRVPLVIPDAAKSFNATSAGWGDVALILPWTMYQVYGDTTVLRTQYGSMKAYVDYIRKTAGDSLLWKKGSIYGDWLFYKPTTGHHMEADAYTNHDLIATAFFAYSTKILAEAAAVLNLTGDAAFYTALHERIKEAFNKQYVTPAGRIFSDSQTGYILALMFDLLPDALRPYAVQYLVEDIRARKNHLSTGFLGTPYICHVLSQNGYANVAYDLLLQHSYPSWLYPVKSGATTIWERWDGIKTDGSFQDTTMNSLNHYAYGAIGDWLYRVVAGINNLEPGYKKISIEPVPDARLSFAKATYESVYGTIRSGWQLQDGYLTMDVQIPPNTTAMIVLPGAKLEEVTENNKPIQFINNDVKQQGKGVEIVTGSGTYHFRFPYRAGNYKSKL